MFSLVRGASFRSDVLMLQYQTVNSIGLLYTFAHSICSLLSNSSSGPDISLGSGTQNNIRSKIMRAKTRQRKQGSLLFKERGGGMPILFFNNNDPGFLHPDFFTPHFGSDFFKFKNWTISSNPEYWGQIDQASRQNTNSPFIGKWILMVRVDPISFLVNWILENYYLERK